MFKRVTVILAVGAALILGITACGPRPLAGPTTGPVSSGDQIEALIKLGQERLAQSRYQGAGDAFRAGLRMDPFGEQDARLLMGLARSQDGAGQTAPAYESLRKLMIKHPDSTLVIEAQLLSASLEKDLERCPEAVTRLRALLGDRRRHLTGDQRARGMSLLASCLTATGDQPGVALRAVQELIGVGEVQMTPRLMERLAELASVVGTAELESLMASVQAANTRAALSLGLAMAYFREGRLDQAQSTLSILSGRPGAVSLQEGITSLALAIEQARLVNPRAVGVILPLSGPYAQHGRRVLAAIELGLGLFGSMGTHPPTIFIEDSKGDPRVASEAVERLVRQRRVIAILGPMGAATSLAAARMAQQEKVPLIALSQVQGVTAAGGFVFQNFFTPAEQVEALLQEFMDQRGLTTFAVMAPRNQYGSGFVKLFASGVVARGGSVVRTVSYNLKQTDFAREVKELVKLPAGNYRPGMPDSPEAVIDFDAVFIPDGPGRTGMVAPNLTYHDVNYVWLLGTNLWHNQDLWKMAGRYLRWAVFPDGFNPDSSNPIAAGFVRDYTQAMGRKPNVLDAHGFDSALILRSLLDRPDPPRTKEALQASLAAIQDMPGVCGRLSTGPDRRVRKQLTLYIHRKGGFVPLGGTQMVKPPPEEEDDGVPKPQDQTSGEDSAQPLPPLGPLTPAPASTVIR